jgi:prolyl-tRNA synthetase
VSTRLVGALIMAHGDDQGLRLPPSIAPHQVVIVPIYRSDEERELVVGEAGKIERELHRRRVRVHVDVRDQHRPGYKFNEWELKGVPVRVELGPRDIAAGQATLFRRDLATKDAVPLSDVGAVVRELLADVQRGLFEDARRFRDEHTYTPATWDEMRDLLSAASGFVVAGWCGDEACEARVKEETKATIRCLPLRRERTDGDCLVCGRPAAERAYWAQAY